MEHALPFQWGNIAALQLILFFTSVLVPGLARRGDLVRAFVAATASYVVSFGPIVLLVYLLYAVSRLY